MAKIYADTNGVILRVLQSADEETMFGEPGGAAFTLEFDEAMNASALADLATDWNAHTMPGGVLTRDGTPVPIAAPGQQFGARQQLASAKQTIQGNAAPLTTYRGLASPTNAQTVAAVKSLIETTQALTVIVRALIREAN